MSLFSEPTVGSPYPEMPPNHLSTLNHLNLAEVREFVKSYKCCSMTRNPHTLNQHYPKAMSNQFEHVNSLNAAEV